jgi:oligopeptide/dipeptide ABC transporter ATP-binding protein
VPGGTSTCAKPGTGPGQCGAGIPAGTKLTFNVLYTSQPAITGEQLTDWASQAKKIGIDIVLKSDTFNHVIDIADDPGSPKTINDWAMADYGGFTNTTYPTTFGIFSTGGSYNGGFWNDPKVNQLINASVTGGNPAAVKAEAAYITAQQPSLFQPNPDYIIVWKDDVSGQQGQRIGLARALTLSPKVIVADEPVSALDVSIRAQVLNLMKRLQADHGPTYIVISHDLAVVKYMARLDRCHVPGKLVEMGPADDIYQRAAHPYTAGLIAAIPVPDPAAAKGRRGLGIKGELPSLVTPPSGCRFRTRCPLAQDLCASEEPQLRSFGPGHVAACHFALQTPAAPPE